MRSVMNGPTIVPWRVMQASTAAAELLIRFITFSSWPTMFSLSRSQSASDLMKKVVLPESPYGVCTTRSVPRPLSVARVASSAQLSAVPRTLGTEGAPASLPSWVVTILESSRVRSSCDGRIRS